MALENDAFDHVGDVFALVDGGFDDLEDLFPLDDLDRVRLFVEKLGDEGAAEAVALVFVAIDFDAVLKGFFRRFEGLHRGGDFGGGRDKDFDEVDGALADCIDAVEDKTAGGGVDEVDHVVELAA